MARRDRRQRPTDASFQQWRSPRSLLRSKGPPAITDRGNVSSKSVSRALCRQQGPQATPTEPFSCHGQTRAPCLGKQNRPQAITDQGNCIKQCNVCGPCVFSNRGHGQLPTEAIVQNMQCQAHSRFGHNGPQAPTDRGHVPGFFKKKRSRRSSTNMAWAAQG